ncbi:uncharacterized protein LOC136010004 [Lathamus discolor]|uniref:uncharacterized protein LOC136010004 n=1 Tax=Lathamus discolor TaxID=678569 RepID=UPI0032B7C838
MALLRLSQLLDAAIAAPDAESVNFRALRNLLQAMLGHLGLQDRSPRGLEQPAERDRARTPAAGQQPQQAGEQLPAKDALQDTAGGSEADVAADVGQPVQRVEGDESSSSEDTAVYQALLEEISQMKEAQSRMQGEIRVIQEALGLGNRQDAAGQLPGLCNPRTLASDVQMLKERLGLYPDPEEVSNMVHWDVLEDCLVGSKGERGRDGGRPRGEQEEEDPSATTKSPTSDVDTPHGASSVPGPRESSAGLKDPGAALTAPEQQAGVPSDWRRDASTRAMMQTASGDVQTTSLGTQPTEPESTGTQTTRLGTQPESTTTQTISLGTQPTAPESTGTQTTRLGTQLESTTTQTTSLGTQPTEPESTGTQTTRLGTQPESTTTQTASLGTQPREPESTGTQTTRLGTQPESTTTQTASLGTQPTEPESTGTQTTRLGTQPESTTTQTASLGTQPTEPESMDTRTTSLGTQPESTTTQTTSLGTQPTEPESTGTQTTRLGMQPESTTTQTASLGTQPESTGTQTTRLRTQPESTTTQTASLGTQPSEPESTGTQTTRLGTQPESTVTQTTTSGEQLSTQLAGAGTLAAGTLLPTAQGLEIPLDADPRATSHVQELALPSGSSSAYHNAYRCYAETVEAVKQIGQLRHLYAALKEQVAQLEASRLERTELEKLRLLLQEAGQESVANTLGDLQAQVSSVQGLARELQGLSRELQGEKGKIRKLENALGKLEAARASWQMDLSDQLSLLSGSTPQEEKRDMKDLSEQQQISKAALDQVVSQTAKGEQEQLEEVRAMESTGQEEAVCPMCSSDTSTRLGKLLRRYEKLQGLVESLMSRKKTGKVVRQLPGKSQDEEALKRIQAAILQMQGEYEQLNSVTGSLLDDSRQQQKDIEGLLQSVERLEKEKADKEDLELGMDEKADKGALESRVSRAQFEASLELLKERNQEVLSRVTGQEQGLHEVQQQLREEMASKLDRLELGPFQQELEEHWKSSLEQLKEMAPPMEADDAAGIRKQLLVDFQCLSCDRQLSMRVPGSPIPPIPPFPPLVPHVTGRSQPVLKTEQTHREPMAACRYPTVPRQCGGQHTLTGPLQRSLRLPPVRPSTPQALQPSTLLPSKQDKVELLGQDSRRAGPCPSAPGTTGPLERRSASSHSHLLQGHQPHPPLQPRRMDAATQQPGRPAGHRLNPIARAPQQARGSSSQQQQ